MMARAGEPPPGLVPIHLKGSVLLLTPYEFAVAVRRGKRWRRREALAKRTQEKQATGHPAPS